MENIYLEIGKRIRQQRKAHGLTREEFAENLSTTMQYISRLERAKNKVSIEYLYRIADALDCSIYTLLPATQLPQRKFFSEELMYQLDHCSLKLAEDALHETCLELIEKIDSIRTDNAKQLAYYLRMVTRNRTIDFMRKWDRRSALSYDAVDVEPASLHEDAADVVLTKMRLETTLKSLDEMPPVYRTALILRVQGYSIKEIAHITNSSAAAVKTRIHRARQLLLQNSQNDP